MAFAYGLYNFGDGYYSETKYVDAAATASVSSSVSASGERIHLALSDVTATGSVSSAGQRIHQSGTQNPLPSSSATANATYECNASATVNAQSAVATDGVRVQFSLGSITTVSTTASNAERIKISGADSIDAYCTTSPVGVVVTAGGSADIAMTSGVSASGEIVYLGAVSGSTASSTLSNGLIVKDGVVAASGSASSTATGERIHLTEMSVDMQASASCDGFINAQGVVSDSVALESSANGERIHLVSSVVTLLSDIDANGRYKYEQIGKENETWAVVPKNNETWTEVA